MPLDFSFRVEIIELRFIVRLGIRKSTRRILVVQGLVFQPVKSSRSYRSTQSKRLAEKEPFR